MSVRNLPQSPTLLGTAEIMKTAAEQFHKEVYDLIAKGEADINAESATNSRIDKGEAGKLDAAWESYHPRLAAFSTFFGLFPPFNGNYLTANLGDMASEKNFAGKSNYLKKVADWILSDSKKI